MFIDDQKYTLNGRTYRRALLRNSYREGGQVRHDTVANLSKCSDEEIEALKFALKNRSRLPKVPISGGEVQTRQGLSIGAVWLLHQLAKELGIAKALGHSREAKLALWLVISSVIGSVSRLSAARLAKSHAACDILGLDRFCEDDLYSTLDWLHERQGVIEDRLFRGRYCGKAPNLFLYDVTSSYLEGDHNELASYGYNRDGKKGKKQVVVGLLTDDEGYPVTCEVFQGDTKDTGTFKSQLEKVARRFGVEKVTFVGDRGMIKSAQIRDLSEEDYYYITALTRPQIEKKLIEGILQTQLFDKTICEIAKDGVRYILRRNPIRANELRDNRKSRLQALRTLCTKKVQYLADHPKAKVATAEKSIKLFADKLKISKWVVISINERLISAEVNRSELDNAEKLDGCYIIKSNIPVEVATKETIHDRYKDLSDVEWAFRTMKTALLHIRGIYVRKANRTKAHVFTIMLAYMLAYKLRRLWHGIDVTIEEGIEELTTLCGIEVVMGDVTINTIPEPRRKVKELLEKANVSLPDAIPCGNANVFTRKSLVDERIIHVNSSS